MQSKQQEIEVKKIYIEDIEVAEKFYTRSSFDEKLVDEYADLLVNGVRFDEIVVCKLGGKLYLADGYHRLLAHKKAGREKIKARIVEVESEAEIIMLSIKSNFKHGKRLDLKYALTKLYKHLRNKEKMPPRKAVQAIAEYLGISKRLAEIYTKKVREEEKKQVENKIRELKKKGLNGYEIARAIEEEYNFPLSISSVKRIVKKETRNEKISEMVSKVSIENKELIEKGENDTETIKRDKKEVLWNISKIAEMLEKGKISKIKILDLNVNVVNGKVFIARKEFANFLKFYAEIVKLYGVNTLLMTYIFDEPIKFKSPKLIKYKKLIDLGHKVGLDKSITILREAEKYVKIHDLLVKLRNEVKNELLSDFIQALIKGNYNTVKNIVVKKFLEDNKLHKVAEAVREYDKTSTLGNVLKVGNSSWLQVLANAIEKAEFRQVYRSLHLLDKEYTKLLEELDKEVEKRLEEIFCGYKA